MDNRCRQDWFWVVQSCPTAEACVFKIRIYQTQTVPNGMQRKLLNKNHIISVHVHILARMMDADNKQPHSG